VDDKRFDLCPFPCVDPQCTALEHQHVLDHTPLVNGFESSHSETRGVAGNPSANSKSDPFELDYSDASQADAEGVPVAQENIYAAFKSIPNYIFPSTSPSPSFSLAIDEEPLGISFASPNGYDPLYLAFDWLDPETPSPSLAASDSSKYPPSSITTPSESEFPSLQLLPPDKVEHTLPEVIISPLLPSSLPNSSFSPPTFGALPLPPTTVQSLEVSNSQYARAPFKCIDCPRLFDSNQALQ
jgi:hypothetical protein